MLGIVDPLAGMIQGLSHGAKHRKRASGLVSIKKKNTTKRGSVKRTDPNDPRGSFWASSQIRAEWMKQKGCVNLKAIADRPLRWDRNEGCLVSSVPLGPVFEAKGHHQLWGSPNLRQTYFVSVEPGASERSGEPQVLSQRRFA